MTIEKGKNEIHALDLIRGHQAIIKNNEDMPDSKLADGSKFSDIIPVRSTDDSGRKIDINRSGW